MPSLVGSEMCIRDRVIVSDENADSVEIVLEVDRAGSDFDG